MFTSPNKFSKKMSRIPVYILQSSSTGSAGEAFTMGFKSTDIFGVFWLSFVAFWTFLALQASMIFAMFSIPFWLVGFVLVGGLLKRVTEKQYIEIDNHNIIIRKKGLFFLESEELSLYSIDKIKRENVKPTISFNKIGNINNLNNLSKPMIKIDLKEVPFLENALKVEQDWAIELLNEILKNYK